MSNEPIVTGHDMSRYWRLVSIENGPVTGTVWVTKPDRGEQHVKPVDLIIWDEGHHSGMTITDLTAWIRDGVVEIPEHMIRGNARLEVLDRIEAVKVAVLAAASAVTWPAEVTE